MYKISVTQTTQLFSRPDSLMSIISLTLVRSSQLFSRPDSLMSIVSLTLVRSCQTASNYTSLSFFLVLFHRMSVLWHSSVGGSETGVRKAAMGVFPPMAVWWSTVNNRDHPECCKQWKTFEQLELCHEPCWGAHSTPTDLTAGGKGVAAPSPGTSPPFSAFGHAPMKKPGLATVLKGIWPVKEFSCISNPERARSLEGLCGRPEEIPQRNRPIKHKLKAAW